jgi:hypothetical protein
MKMIMWTHDPKGPYEIVVGEDEEMNRTYADMKTLAWGTEEERAAVLQRHVGMPVKPCPNNPATIPFSIHLLTYEVVDSAGKGAHLWKQRSSDSTAWDRIKALL